MVEVGDEFDEAEVDKRIPAANNAAIDLLFADGGSETSGQFGHDVVDSPIEFVSEFLVDEILVLLIDLANVVVDHGHLLEVLFIDAQDSSSLLLLGDEGNGVEGTLVEPFEAGQFLLEQIFFVIVFEGVHEVAEPWQRLERG